MNSVALAASAPRVSVVVVSFNGRRHLERCLPALLASWGVSFEVILVDNASSDGTVAWVRESFPTVRLLPQATNRGFGAANAVGIAAARAEEFVALVNSDTEVEPDWLARLLAPFDEAPDLAATCAVLVFMDRPTVLNADGGGMTWLGVGFDRELRFPIGVLEGRPVHEEVLFPTAAAAVLRKADFLAVGGFDRSFFMYHEDVDLGWRLWLAGRRVLVCRDVVVKHAWGGSTGEARGIRWRDRLGARHAVRTLLKCYQPYQLLRAVKNLTKVWARERAWGRIARATAWNLVHLPGTICERARVQRDRVRPDSWFVAHGLLDEAPFPPPRPELPSPEATLPESPFASSSLMPGHDSAHSRLGEGWYTREQRGGEWIRYTCGLARCWLNVVPGAEGTVRVAVALPAGAQSSLVEVHASGAQACLALRGSDWQEVVVPALAGPDGRIGIDIVSPTVVPHRTGKNWDFRPLGCAVRRVRFVSTRHAGGRPAPSVSVVIPTYNRVETLLETLDRLAGQTAAPVDVVVVDDGSTDDTRTRLEEWRTVNATRLPLTVIRQPNSGPGAARNRGVAAARGELVMFLGDDTLPAPDFVERHAARHAAEAPGEPLAVVGLTEWDHAGMRVTPFLEHVNRNGEQFAYGRFHDGDELPFNCLYTSNLSLPRAILGEAPFRTEFRYAAWEDAELGYRLCRRGLRIVYCAGATTVHRHPMTMWSFLARQARVGETVDTLFAMHPELHGDPGLPGLRFPRRYPLLALLMPLAARVMSAWDATGRSLPRAAYREAIIWSYFKGRARALRERR